MKDNKKTKQVIAITVLTSLILIMAVTTAYFAVSVSNTNNERINTTSSQLSIVYTDCASSKQSDCANMTKNLAQDESFEKTFKVYNNGTMPVDYKIIFKELTNTFKKGDLVYTIKDLNDNVLQSERPIPYASNQTTNVNAFLDTIEANTTKEFKIVVKLKETTDDQTENASATYSIKLGLSSQNGGTDNILNLVRDADASSTDIITKTAPSGSACTNTFAYDGTVDNNLRYVGADPCNYVSFNNELWRIIGIMNNIDDGDGNIETRIKLIRNDSLGDYSWDTSESSVNSGVGINDWSQADLMTELNGNYLNTTLQTDIYWYSGRNNETNNVYRHIKGLKSETQELISNAKWYLGGQEYEVYNPAGAGTSKKFFEYERGNRVYSGRPLNWTGKVALMYPSDYGYAVGGTVRSTCLEQNLNVYSSGGCSLNDWLQNNIAKWVISPNSYTNHSATLINNIGEITNAAVYWALPVYPALYLKSTVQISGGNGSQENPYTLK